MTTNKQQLIGHEPNQVPTNAMLGNAAYLDREHIEIKAKTMFTEEQAALLLAKQVKLVSGTHIKTLNNRPLNTGENFTFGEGEVGDVIISANPTPPSEKWMLNDNQTLLKSSYPALGDFMDSIGASSNATMQAWQLVFTTSVPSFITSAVAISSTVVVAVGYRFSDSFGVVYRSADAGITWALVYTATVVALLQSVAKLTDTVIVAVGYGTSSAGAFYLSTNAGATWTTAGTLAASTAMRSVTRVSDTVAVAVGSNANNYALIYRTTNSGASWTLAYTGTVTGSLYAVTAVTATELLAFGQAASSISVVYRSVNGGVSWTAITSANFAACAPAGITAVTSSLILAVGFNATGTKGIVYRSTDAGLTWTAPFTTPASMALISVARITDNELIMSGYYTATLLGVIYRSTDAGVTWSLVHTTASSAMLNGVILKVSDTIRLVTGRSLSTTAANGVIYRLVDDASTYTAVRLPKPTIASLGGIPRYAYTKVLP